MLGSVWNNQLEKLWEEAVLSSKYREGGVLFKEDKNSKHELNQSFPSTT
jgi:hypothetical protein